MDVIVRPHLLSEREQAVLQVAPGTTLAQMVAAYPWPAGVEQHAVVLMNGEAVPREWWTRIRPHEGTRVDIALGLHGGGGNKQTLALIASIAVSVASYGILSGQIGFVYGAAISISPGVLAAGVALVGNLALGAIFKPPPVQFDQNTQQASKQYTFGGQSNAPRPYGVLPRVLGRHRVYADLIGTPYTELKGDDQWMLALYCFGYGGVTIESVCIGDNPIDQYEEAHNIWPDYQRGDPLLIYATDVSMVSSALALIYNNPVIMRTGTSTKTATVDLQFPTGLGRLNPTTGGMDQWIADQVLEFRSATALVSDPWLSLTEAPWMSISEGYLYGRYDAVIRAPIVQGNDPAQPRYATLAAGTTQVTLLSWNTANPRPPARFDYMRIGDVRMQVSAFAAPVVTFMTGLPKTVSMPDYGSGSTGKIAAAYYTKDIAEWYIARHQLQPFIASFSVQFPSMGQWDIRVTSRNVPSGDSNVQEARSVIGVRSESTATQPVYPDLGVPLALLELRIKATEQLSGVVANLNAIVTTKVPTWTGSAWTAPDVTGASNPAWQFCELLRGVANTRAIDTNPAIAPIRLDMATIKRWADYCDTVGTASGFTQPNGTCDFVVDKPYTLWELLSSVATAGRAMPTMRDNRYSVIIDEETKPEVQVFSTRNSWGLSARRKYLPLPDALRAKWINPAAGYVEDDAPIYAAGFSEQGEVAGTVSAKVFEDLPLFGCTTWEKANRDGRLWFARAQLQQEEFTVSTDIENVVCTRGDLIGIAHDVLQVGGWSARIAAVSGTQIQFDSALKSFATPWALRHRSDAGVISGALSFTAAAGGWFDVPALPAAAKVGDLVLYGTSGVEQGRYLVKAVTPGNDLTATIDCIEYAPGIYAAEKAGVIPPYVPQGKSPVVLNPQPVLGLVATVNAWVVNRYPHAGVTLQWTRPASTVQPSSYIINAVASDGTVSEVGRTTNMSFVALPDVDTSRAPWSGAAVTYEVIAQWPGIVGPPSRVSATLPVGAVTALPAITGFTATPEPRRVYLQWDASTQDVAYYVARWGTSAQAVTALAATEQKVKANRTEYPGSLFVAGDFKAWVCQEDTNGLRGAWVSAAFHVDAPRIVNIVGAAVQNTVFLRWGSLSGVPAGTWTAQTTFAIEYYTVTKTRAATARTALHVGNGVGTIPANIVTAQDLAEARQRDAGDPPIDLGRYAGEFAVLSEQQLGTWHYCMSGVDIAGNAGPQACIDLQVTAPSDYFLLDTLANILNQPETTTTNAVQNIDLSWLAPVNTSQTWSAHYTSHTWDQPQDQVDAGFPIYAQPPGTTKGTFSWTHDYGTNLPALHLTSSAFFTGIGGTPLVTLIEFAKANAGDAWVEIGRQATSINALLPPGTRFIRIDVEVLSDSPTNKALANLSRVEFILDVQFKDDSGTVTVPAGGSVVVPFNVTFLDVRSVVVTSADPAVAYARYTLASDDQSMTVYAFNSVGAPVGGNVSWMARGI